MRHAHRALLLGLVAALAAGSAFAQVDFSRYVALGDSITAGYEFSWCFCSSERLDIPAQ